MKIEKCPFCGYKAILCGTGNQFATEKFFVSCGVCGVETPRIARTRKEAIAAWNRRDGKDTNVTTNNAVPVVRGRWTQTNLFDEEANVYVCSVCGEPWTLNAGTPQENNMNFCPNCGADMRGGEANTYLTLNGG